MLAERILTPNEGAEMENNDNLRMKLLGKWGKWASIHWGKTLLIALGITLIMGIGASRLKLEMTFYSMMPKGSQQVRDMKRIIENFPVASSIVVVLEAKEKDDRAQAEITVKKAVDILSRELLKSEFSEYIIRVQGKLDIDFFKEHGLMLSKAEDIERVRRMYSNINLVPLFSHLNDDFEREYSGDEEKLSDDEELAIAQFEGLEQILKVMESSAASERISAEAASASIERFLFGSPYYLSRDSTMALLFIQPTFTINDFMLYAEIIPLMEKMIKERTETLGVSAGLTGMLVVGKDEMVTSEQGLALSMLIAVMLILLLMILSFRMYSVPFISGIPLFVGIMWTMGLAGFTIKRLNIMTAMYMVVLLGLGIDYAIHLLTSFMQEREDGNDFTTSVGNSLKKSGAGIFTGALTTAVAFFMLVIARSNVVRELGVVAGFGILSELVAMIIMVPALLGFRNHRLVKKGKSESKLLEKFTPGFGIISSLGTKIKGRPALFIFLMLAAGILLATQAGKVDVEGNMMKMEAKGLESIELQDRMVEEFGMAPDVMSITMTDLDKMRPLGKRIKKLASVKAVESLIPYYPSVKEQFVRAGLVEKFKGEIAPQTPEDSVDTGLLIEEIYRLEDNLLEMSDLAFMAGMDRMFHKLNILTGRNEDGQKVAETVIDRLIASIEENPESAEGLVYFQRAFVPSFKEKLINMANTEQIIPDMIPPFILDSFRSRDGKNYLMNVIPTQNPWDEEYRKVFTGQLETITDKATGMVLAANQMLEIVNQDGIKAAIAALIAIFILLIIDFRNIKLSLVTLLPLLLAFVSLFGIMAIARIKFDFINIIAVPLLIGIGIDDVVHFNHRYLLEGKGNMDRVVAKIGRAVLLTTITTIIGFGSFIPSIMRAMRSTGIVLSIAMALAFLYSILLHPAVLIVLTEKLKLNIKPWNVKRRDK
ncbi:MAG: MMPL family transporter [Spirochaeta sp.]|nr:MMPL family transporter [Spirochaeta sp.]